MCTIKGHHPLERVMILCHFAPDAAQYPAEAFCVPGREASVQSSSTIPISFERRDLVGLLKAPTQGTRAAKPEIRSHIDVRKWAVTIWLGRRHKSSAFTFAFEKPRFGCFRSHPTNSARTFSTVIVETREEPGRHTALDKADIDQSIHFGENLFAAYSSQFAAAVAQRAHIARFHQWLHFNRVVCGHWHYGTTRCAHRICPAHGSLLESCSCHQSFCAVFSISLFRHVAIC